MPQAVVGNAELKCANSVQHPDLCIQIFVKLKCSKIQSAPLIGNGSLFSLENAGTLVEERAELPLFFVYEQDLLTL